MTSGYLTSTRHPWPSLLFVLPLLIAYEACVILFGGAHPETLRNGADNWLRGGFTAIGLKQVFIPPLVLIGLFGVWSYLKRGEKATSDELLALCRERLDSYKVPRQIEFRSELPKNFVGKVLRRLLVET